MEENKKIRLCKLIYVYSYAQIFNMKYMLIKNNKKKNQKNQVNGNKILINLKKIISKIS